MALSHGTFNGFSNGMCVHTSLCELGLSQRFPEDKPRLAASRLASPRFASRHRNSKASCLEKKMEKGRRHTQKYFIAAGVSVREGKNSDVRLTFSALQVRRWSSESLHRSVQLKRSRIMKFVLSNLLRQNDILTQQAI